MTSADAAGEMGREGEKPVRLAASILRVLDLAGSRYPNESDLGTPELALADRIKALYSKYKSEPGMDFTSAALRARAEIVSEMLTVDGQLRGEAGMEGKS